jgi:hypothetical protein
MIDHKKWDWDDSLYNKNDQRLMKNVTYPYILVRETRPQIPRDHQPAWRSLNEGAGGITQQYTS